MKTNQKIITFLTFDNQAEEAMNLYTSVFKNSKILNVFRAPANEQSKEGSVISGTFEIEGQVFYTLNGGSHFSFAQGISLFVNCETQEEVDELWSKLSEGGEEQPCGWLKDKFGVSWQIIPRILGELLQDKNPEKAGKVMQAMLQMKKIDISKLKQAYES